MSKEERAELEQVTREKQAQKYTMPERVTRLETEMKDLKGTVNFYLRITLIAALFGSPVASKFLDAFFTK